MTTAPTALHRGPRPNRMLVIALALIVVVAGVAGYVLGRRSTSGPSDVIRGSGTAATATRDVGAFTSVDLAGSNNVSIQVGDARSVVVHGDDNLLGLVTTKVKAGRLVIGNRGSFSTGTPMSVDVTVPRLEAITLSGSGTVTVQGVESKELIVRLPGSGVIRVTGTTGRLEATLDGSGDLFAGDLVAARATALVSGSGVIQLSATESLHASVTGSGTILYGGNPKEVSKSVTGSGAVVGQ